MKYKITLLFTALLCLNINSYADNKGGNDSENCSDSKIENISSKLDIKYSAVSMITSLDNSILIYSTEIPGKKNSLVFYYTKFNSKSCTWSNPIEIDHDFNNLSSEESMKITINKKEYFVSKNNKNIYSIKFTKNKWKKPKKLNSNVNSKKTETSACISPDGVTLYFSSNREGGYGGKDIYACDRLSDGGWSKAYNLGNGINTPQNEESPFMLSDNSTLYFSSKGHNSIGGYDVFYATISDDGFWDDIDHLKAPVNSKGDDLYFIVSDDEENAFFSSSQENTENNLDIFRVNYNSTLR